MEYNYLYLIECGNNSFVISAKNSFEAVTLWIEHKNDEREKDNRSRSYYPGNFSVRQLEREDFVIRGKEL